MSFRTVEAPAFRPGPKDHVIDASCPALKHRASPAKPVVTNCENALTKHSISFMERGFGALFKLCLA